MVKAGSVRVMILRAPGTNCERETAYAFELAGAEPNYVHVNEVIAGREHLKNYQILALPGGFSYGDDLGAGKVQATEMRACFGQEINDFMSRGGLVIGICN